MAKAPAIYSSTGPRRDIRFVLEELLQVGKYSGVLRGYQELLDPELGDTILDTASTLAQEVLTFHNSETQKPEVTTANEIKCVELPDEMKRLYTAYIENSFTGVTAEEEHGGIALPELANTLISEIFNSADISWTMLPILIQGGYAAIRDHGSEELQAMFLPGIVEGKIAVAMDMTEPGAGTGLGSTRATATTNDDGTYNLSGSKIFITFGDHNATENIVHLVLARLPDAPGGVKGLTLFAVPKMIDGKRNTGVEVTGIEGHKLGLYHSPTCSMEYTSATAYLVGEENGGIKAMFTMMNEARLHVGIQAVGAVETAYQNTLKYVQDRYVDDKPLIEKDDVRRKLLAMRSMVESGRALAAFVSLQMDIAHHHPNEEKKNKARALVDLLTPVMKGYFTDKGVRAVREGLELHGGYGYTEEFPLAQLDRDIAVTPIYEGVNAVQATAILRSLKNIAPLTNEMREFAESRSGCELAAQVSLGANMVDEMVQWLSKPENKKDRDAAATDFMHLLGTVVSGYMLAKSATIAEDRLKESGLSEEDKKFYEGKIDTATYFVKRELQRYTNHIGALKAGRESVRMRDVLPEKAVEKPGAGATGTSMEGDGPEQAAGAARA